MTNNKFSLFYLIKVFIAAFEYSPNTLMCEMFPISEEVIQHSFNRLSKLFVKKRLLLLITFRESTNSFQTIG